MEGGLKGIVKEWEEWALGTRGEVFEDRQVQGLREVLHANEAEPAAAERAVQAAIDVSAGTVRMWVDGRLVGEVRQPPPPSTEWAVQLPAGAVLESLEAAALPPGLDEWLPLDLSGYCDHAAQLGSELPRA